MLRKQGLIRASGAARAGCAVVKETLAFRVDLNDVDQEILRSVSFDIPADVLAKLRAEVFHEQTSLVSGVALIAEAMDDTRDGLAKMVSGIAIVLEHCPDDILAATLAGETIHLEIMAHDDLEAAYLRFSTVSPQVGHA
jgi:hypothetical protein